MKCHSEQTYFTKNRFFDEKKEVPACAGMTSALAAALTFGGFRGWPPRAWGERPFGRLRDLCR